jgi:hypothetical protein
MTRTRSDRRRQRGRRKRPGPPEAARAISALARWPYLEGDTHQAIRVYRPVRASQPKTDTESKNASVQGRSVRLALRRRPDRRPVGELNQGGRGRDKDRCADFSYFFGRGVADIIRCEKCAVPAGSTAPPHFSYGRVMSKGGEYPRPFRFRTRRERQGGRGTKVAGRGGGVGASWGGAAYSTPCGVSASAQVG